MQASKKKLKGTSYVAPVKRENENILSFVKTTNYKTVLILWGHPILGSDQGNYLKL